MMSELEAYKVFLIEYLHVDEIKHGDKTLWDHLFGVSTLLATWGNGKEIVVAGLFHSIYGTQNFRTRAFPVEGRWIIQRLIGKEAESIVHVFCTSDRNDFLLHGDYRAINEIEIANLIEQGGNNARAIAAILEKGNLSIGARAAGQEVMKGLESGETKGTGTGG